MDVNPYYGFLSRVSKDLEKYASGLGESFADGKTAGHMLHHAGGKYWQAWQEMLPPATDLSIDFALHQEEPELLTKVLEILNQVFSIRLPEPLNVNYRANIDGRNDLIQTIFDRFAEVYESVCRSGGDLQENFSSWFNNLTLKEEHLDLRSAIIEAVAHRNKKRVGYVSLAKAGS